MFSFSFKVSGDFNAPIPVKIMRQVQYCYLLAKSEKQLTMLRNDAEHKEMNDKK
jgi:hypothetical protein